MFFKMERNKWVYMVVFSFTFLFFYQGIAKGGVWKIFDHGETFFYYYFEDTMKKSPSGIISVWIRTVPQKNISFQQIMEEREKTGMPLRLETEDYGYSMMFVKIHCNDKLAKVIQEKIYSKKGFLLDSSFKTVEWKPVMRGSFSEALFAQICPEELVKN